MIQGNVDARVFARKPAAVIGTSPGAIGTAIAQQQLKSVLSFCNAPQMNSPEAYIQFKPGLITDDGQVTDELTEDFLRGYMADFLAFVTREAVDEMGLEPGMQAVATVKATNVMLEVDE